MNDTKPGAVRIVRSANFVTHSPDTLRAGLVSSDPVRRVDVVLMNEDTVYSTTQSQGEVVFVEAVKLSLRPDKALDLARLIVKCLDLLVLESEQQAAMLGITRDKLDHLGMERFEVLK